MRHYTRHQLVDLLVQTKKSMAPSFAPFSILIYLILIWEIHSYHITFTLQRSFHYFTMFLKSRRNSSGLRSSGLFASRHFAKRTTPTSLSVHRFSILLDAFPANEKSRVTCDARVPATLDLLGRRRSCFCLFCF